MGQIAVYKRKNRPLVYLRYTFKRQSVLFSTGIRLKDEQYDFKRQKVKMFDHMFDHYEQVIEKMTNRVKAMVHELIIRQKEPTAAAVKMMFDSAIIRSGVDYDHLRTEYLSERALRYRENTVKTDGRMFTKISEWKGSINVHTFSESDIEDFLHYLYRTGMANNSVTTVMVRLKTFLRWGYMKQYHRNMVWEKIKTRYEVGDVIFLTKEELMRMENVQLPPHLHKYRQVYVFMCYTGMSIGDAKMFTPSMVVDGVIVYDRMKSGSKGYIPYSNKLRSIIEDLGGSIPPLTDQKMNKYIKQVARMAMIDVPVIVRHRSGSKVIKTKMMKWEKVTTHTARKTFVTLCYQRNIHELAIMQMGGYKDSRSLRSYRGLDINFIKDQYGKLNGDQGQ